MDQNSKKHKVAESALDLIENGEVLGIGSGSTVNILIEHLHKVKNKIQNVVSSSIKSTELLKANGFDVDELRNVGKLSKYIDGADEVNKYLHMIKGGGGALTREKILAHNSEKFICIVDESKKVDGRIVLRNNFNKLLEKFDNLLIFGEDSGKIGDVNQGLEGLQEIHGKERVGDRGIREASIVGEGIGLSLRGFRPIAEIQYLDYV